MACYASRSSSSSSTDFCFSHTYKSQHGKVDADEYARMRADFDAGNWDASTVDVRRRTRGRLTITRVGHPVVDSEGKGDEIANG